MLLEKSDIRLAKATYNIAQLYYKMGELSPALSFIAESVRIREQNQVDPAELLNYKILQATVLTKLG